MIIVQSDPPSASPLAEQLLMERRAIARFVDVVERLQRTIGEYEQRYGIDSVDVPAAIDEGRLIESTEVCDWLLDYELLQRARAVAR